MKAPPKILILGPLPPPHHGTSAYLKDLIETPWHCFTVCHVDTSDHRNDLNNLGKTDLKNLYYALKSVVFLIVNIIDKHPNVVYFCTSQNIAYLRDGLFVVVTKMLSRAKVVQHLHGANFSDYYNQASFLMKKYIDFTQRRVDGVIVLGNALTDNFTKWIDNDRIFVIPNGLKDSNATFGVKPRRMPKLYFLGNLLEFKGFLDCIRILVIVKTKYPEIMLNIGGAWADDPIYHKSNIAIKEEFEHLVHKNKLENNITFYGQVLGEEKKKLINESDILVYPTHYDAFPLVILEAMSAGNPVISTTGIGAINEIVETASTGFLLEENDINGMAEKIILLVENPFVFQSMRSNAINRFNEYYRFDTHVEKMIAMFNTVLNRD